MIFKFNFFNSKNDAEEWAATKLKKYRANGLLDWSREEQTIFDKGRSNPRRIKICFQQPMRGSYLVRVAPIPFEMDCLSQGISKVEVVLGFLSPLLHVKHKLFLFDQIALH